MIVTSPGTTANAVGEPTTAATDPYAVLRNRDLLLYLTGRFVASLGQQMLTVAVGWELYERTNSALALGLVGLTQMVPMILFTLPAGHFPDNYSPHAHLPVVTFLIAFARLGFSPCSSPKAGRALSFFCLFPPGTP